MKLEKIDDNTIKCVLTSSDLMDRNIQLSDLAYGGDTTRELFTEMLEQASEDFNFDVNGAPFMIEAVPLRDGGIELLLTKVDDPLEVDVRFSKLTKAVDGPPYADDQTAADTLCGAGKPSDGRAVFVFDTLDGVIEISRNLFGLFEGKSILYKNPENKKFYLYIDQADRDPIMFASTCNILSEYASGMPQSYAVKSFLDEHFETIVKEDALHVLATI